MNSTKITFIIASIIFFVAILFLPCKNFWSGNGWVVRSISEHCSGDISKFTKDYELSFLYPGGKSLRNISIVMHNEKGFTSEDRLRFVNIVDEKMRKEIEGE